MNRATQWGTLLALAMMASPALGGPITASAVITSQLDADGVDFDYNITLTNSPASANVIGTFWFSWVPGKDFMLNNPISVTSPMGWSDTVTNAGASDGFAIRWESGSPATDITPGNSLQFAFVSAETPAQIAGFSPFFPTFPELTSVLYQVENPLPVIGTGTTFQVRSRLPSRRR